MKLSKTTHPLPFDQLSGHQFERLAYAFFYRRWIWRRLEWYGESGSDGGRDIIGERDDEYGRSQAVVVACANWRTLNSPKVTEDIDAMLESGTKPDYVYAVGGGRVGAGVRKKIREYGLEKSIQIETWSGTEFEERLRVHAYSVVERLFEGEELPGELEDLRTLGNQWESDMDGLSLLTRVFDRPAFYTLFRDESQLPAFKKAISDTIEALNTGICRTRDGTVVGRVPSRRDFASEETQTVLADVVDALVSLRKAYDDGIRSGAIKPFGNPERSWFQLTDEVAEEMDNRRRDVLALATQVIPDLRPLPT